MTWSRRDSNKYGMPRHVVRGERPSFASPLMNAWYDVRDQLEAAKLDAERAYDAALIDRVQLANELSRLNGALWRAQNEYTRAHREQLRFAQKAQSERIRRNRRRP